MSAPPLTDPSTGLAEVPPALRDRLERTLHAAARSGVGWLDRAIGRMLRRPGKRLRPALLLAVAAHGPATDVPAALTCAAAVELLHQSSLIHDDLMDQATFRGDEITLHASDGPVAALLGGDYLVAAGGRLIAGAGGEAATVWHEAYADMCAGQASETANRYRLISGEEYLRTVRGKTAALIRATCRLGARCGGMDDRQVRAFAHFGEAFGVVFQQVDDLLDVLSTVDLCGKPVRGDVPQGSYTLPVLAAVRARPGLRELLGRDMSATSLSTVYETVRDLGVPPAVAAVYEWADRARAALGACPASAGIDTLSRVPERYATWVLSERVAIEYRSFITPLLGNRTDIP